MPAFFGIVQHVHVDRHLGGGQIGAGRSVDRLSDDRLALGDLGALSVDGRDPFSLSAPTSSAGKLFGRGPRGLPDWLFWKGLPHGG